ncbi:MAG: choice-of-anchor D domain-containing protein [Phycisphaerae bacterium]|nr:choice-of-anchor D domain-containing protein [Phycisphaerae bacterium]
MSSGKAVSKRRKRLSIEPLEPRRLLDVSGVWQEMGFRSASGGGISYEGYQYVYDDDGSHLLYGHSGDPAAANTPQGHTVLVYENTSGLQAKLFDGFAWLDLYVNPEEPTDLTLPGTAVGRDPDVAVDSYGNIYVTWVAGADDDSDIYMLKGSLEYNVATNLYAWTWSGLGGSNMGTGLSDDGTLNGPPAIAVGPDNLPVIAYSGRDHREGDLDVVAKKWIGGRWVELTSTQSFADGGGGVSNDKFASAGWANDPQPVDIAIGSDNAPIVVWSSQSATTTPAQIYARRWDQASSSWQKIGGNTASDPNENPAPGISDDPTHSIYPRIAIRRVGEGDLTNDRDIVMVTWLDYEDDDDLSTGAIYLKELQFTPGYPSTASWVEVSPGSASGDGLTTPLDFTPDNQLAYYIGEYNAPRGLFRYLSIDIGSDGLPIIGVTHRQPIHPEYYTDVNENQGADDGWFAYGLEAIDLGGSITWRLMGPTGYECPNYGVSWAQNTEIIELPDGSPAIFYGAEREAGIIDEAGYWQSLTTDSWMQTPYSEGARGGGPYDPYYNPLSLEAEIYGHKWNADENEWQNIGDGSGEYGGIDDSDIRWNSDPVLGNLDDGRSIIAYLERIGTQLFVRVRVFDPQTGAWERLGEENSPLVVNMDENDVGEFSDAATATYGDHTYRYDELVLCADPGFTTGSVEGRPVIAYLDYVNTDDASVYGKSTVTVLAYVEPTLDHPEGYWERLANPGEDYVCVTEGTVWEGYLIDQLDVIAGRDEMAYVAFRYVTPDGGEDVDLNHDSFRVDHAHIEDVYYGGNTPYTTDANGNALRAVSEIYALEWDGSSWGAIGDPNPLAPEYWPIDLSGTFGSMAAPYFGGMLSPDSGNWNSDGYFNPSYSDYMFEGYNFDPSLMLDPDGDVWIAFTVGRTAKHWVWYNKDPLDAPWWEAYETPSLLTEIVVYQYDAGDNLWTPEFGAKGDDATLGYQLLAPDGGMHAYAHPELTLGSNNRPILVYEDQTWEMLRIQDVEKLALDNDKMSSNANDRPLTSDDPGVATWAVYLPDGAEPGEVEEGEGLDFANNWVAAQMAATPYHWGAKFSGAIIEASNDVDFFVLTNLEAYRSYNVTVDADFTYGPDRGEEEPAEGRALVGYYDPDVGAFVSVRNSGEYDLGTNPSGIDDAHPFQIVANADGEIWIAITGDDDYNFDGSSDHRGGPSPDDHLKDFGTYTLTVEAMDTPGVADRVFVVEDGFQRLVTSSIRVLSYEQDPVGAGEYWELEGTLTPESGRAYVLPKAATLGNGEVVLTYTTIEPTNAGFVTSLITEWGWDPEAKAWYRAAGYNCIDLGIRSYFEGGYGVDGLMDDDPDEHDYSDLICDIFDPRVMYGARQIDFEKAWWHTQGGKGVPGNDDDEDYLPYAGWRTYASRWIDDYLTPLPGDGESDSGLQTDGYEWGWRADGHVSHTSYIYATRIKKNQVGAWEFEQLTSQDMLGNTLPSSQGNGLNSWVNLDGGMAIAWAPGFISDVGIRGVGPTLNDAQPVVTWNHVEMNLIQVRGWAPDDGTDVNLPNLQVTELSGTPNDNMLVFGRLHTVDSSTPIGNSQYYRVIDLKNTGNEDLIIYGLYFGGSGIFTATDVNNNPLDYPITITPGDDQIVRIHVKPTEAGPAHGMIYIDSNDPLQEVNPNSVAPYSEDYYTIAIQGIAYKGGNIEVTEDVGTPNDLAVTFGLQETGQTSTRVVTITNNGTGPLTIGLNVSGTGLDTYESFRIRKGAQLLAATELTIDAGESEEVEIVFTGTDANETGVIGYLVITHDDWGDAVTFDPVTDRRPYIVKLIGNMPSVEDNVEVAMGSQAALSANTVAYNVGGSLVIYDITTGTSTVLAAAGAGRARSDGNLTVYTVSGSLFVYDHSTGANIDLSALLGITAVSNPNIDGNRIVFAGPGSGGKDIHVLDLNMETGSVVTSDPIASHMVIPDVDPLHATTDDMPDVSGDLVVWRRGTESSGYFVWGYDLALSEPLQLTFKSAGGPRIPRVSGDFVVWIEHNGGNVVRLYERNAPTKDLFLQQADMSDEVAFYGALLVWSDNRNGDFDLYGYYLPTAVLGDAGVDIRDRQFQLTFTTHDEINPDVWGNVVAWRDDQTGMIYFSEVPYGVPDIDVPLEGSTVDLGDVVAGKPVTYDFAIYNQGTGPLNIDVLRTNIPQAVLIPMSEPGAGDDLRVQQGSVLWVRLILTATDEGPIGGTITIESDDADEPLITFDFTAVAQVPILSISETSGTPNDDVLEMANLFVGQSTTAQFTIRNDATVAPLLIEDIIPSDGDLTWEIISGSAELQPGQQAVIQITWKPLSAGTLNATLDIMTNDYDNRPYTLSVTGVAEGIPDLTVEEASGLINDDRIYFGQKDIGSGLIPQTMTIKNVGTEILQITSWEIVGDGAAAFTLESGGLPLPSSFTLAPNGGSKQVTVWFDTTNGGKFEAVFLMQSNDPLEPGAGYGVVLEGTVKYGEAFTTPAKLDFGEVERGQTSVTKEFTVVNTGLAPLEVTGVVSTNPAFVITKPSGYTGVFTLNPGQSSAVFLVTFKPTATTTYTGNIRVTSDDPQNPILLGTTLIGEGINVPKLVVQEPVGAPSDQHMDLGVVTVGESASKTIRIRNSGTGVLRLKRWTTDNNVFQIIPSNGSGSGDDILLAVGQYIDVTVTFTPTADVSYPATITIVSDDPNLKNGVFEIDVTGQGEAAPLVGDFTGDGNLDANDFDLFQAAFGSKKGQSRYGTAYDMDSDGDVDFADLGIFLGYFNEATKASSKAIVASYINSPTDGESVGVPISTEGIVVPLAATGSEKPAASSKLATPSDEADQDPMLVENLAAAFDSGALPDGAIPAATSVDLSSGSVSNTMTTPAGFAAADVVQAASLSGMTVTGSAQVTTSIALSLENSGAPADTLSADDLGQVDPLVAPYASALLGSAIV